MRFSTSKIFQSSLKTEWSQAVFLLLLVMLFAINSLGLLDVNFNDFPGLHLKLERLITQEGNIELPLMGRSAEFYLMLFSGILLSLALPIFTPIAASVLVLIMTIPSATLGIGYPFWC